MTTNGEIGNRPGSLFVFAVVGISTLGIALRLAQYLHNRALWLDEAALALQVIYKSPAELLGPLSWHQNSPSGFLLTIKGIAEALGTSELSLRLFPLIAGVACIPAFLWLLRQGTENGTEPRWEAVLFGLMLFAIGKHLIYYSSELRHYSFDVFAVCLIVCVSRWARRGDEIHYGRLGILAVVGVVASWMVLSSIFTLAATTATYGILSVLRGRYLSAAITAGIGLVWLAVFLVHLGFVSSSIEARGMRDEIEVMNAMSWAPLPFTLEAVEWYRGTFDLMFYHPVGLTYRGLGGFAFLLGLVGLWRRDRALFLLVVLPILFALAASYLHRYPFRDRYIHFLAPLLIVGIAKGVGMLSEPRRTGLRIAGGLLALMLLAQPTYHALKIFQHARGGYEIRPLIEYVDENWTDGDGVYVPLTSVPPFLYYWPRIGEASVRIPDELLYGQTETTFPGLISDSLCLEPDFAWGLDRASGPAQLPALMKRAGRVWILYQYDTRAPIDTPVGAVDEIGRLVESRHAEGASLYRYEHPESD